MNSGIYSISLDNIIIYVGQSRNIKNRWRFHLYELKNNIHKNIYLQRIYNKNNNFVFNIVEQITDFNNLTKREVYYIRLLKPKCNMTIPDKNNNWETSVERNLKVSKALKGKKKSDQHRKNISLGRKGIKLNYNVWNKKLIVYNDIEDSISGWEKRLGMKQNTLNARLRRGWNIKEAIEKPVRKININETNSSR